MHFLFSNTTTNARESLQHTEPGVWERLEAARRGDGGGWRLGLAGVHVVQP